MGLSFLIFPIFIFLKLAKVLVKVTGSRRQENGLVVPGSFLTRTTSRVMIRTTTFEEEIIRLKSLCTHVDIKKARKGKGRGSLFPSLHESPLPSPHPPPPLSLSTPSTEVGRGLYEWEQQLFNALSISKSLLLIKTKNVVDIKMVWTSVVKVIDEGSREWKPTGIYIVRSWNKSRTLRFSKAVDLTNLA